MVRIAGALAVVLAAVLAVFGLGVVPATGSNGSPGAGGGGPSATAIARASAVKVAPAVRAIRTARRDVGGRPYDIERERLLGKRVWEVKLARANGRPREVHVSANGRRVLRRDTTGRSEEARHARQAKVGLVAAIRKAARHANGRLEDAEIDDRDGQFVWEVKFVRRGIETDVYIRTDTGAIVEIDRDDD